MNKASFLLLLLLATHSALPFHRNYNPVNVASVCVDSGSINGKWYRCKYIGIELNLADINSEFYSKEDLFSTEYCRFVIWAPAYFWEVKGEDAETILVELLPPIRSKWMWKIMRSGKTTCYYAKSLKGNIVEHRIWEAYHTKTYYPDRKDMLAENSKVYVKRCNYDCLVVPFSRIQSSFKILLSSIIDNTVQQDTCKCK